MTDKTEKIENWKKKLLDLGKKNRMLNFKENKTSTLKILYPDADKIFESLFDSVIYEIEYCADEGQTKKTETKKLKSKKISKLLCDKNQVDGKKILYRLRSKAKNAIEEQGINLLYLAFGFLEWKEAEHGEVFKSPLLLVPVNIKIDSLYYPYNISIYEEEAIVNPTLKYKMKESFNIDLPEFDHDDDRTITEYLTLIRNLIQKSDWTVNSEVHLGFFSFAKLNMYMDLNNNKNVIVENPLIKGLCGEIIESNGFNPEKVLELDDIFKAENSFCVVDADSSQLEAIYYAAQGKSFVLQGPPGTGKSQTITNIIASCMVQGKNVLFVSEKMAALEVVYNNLKRVGLEDFCLQLHSHKANKKEVTNELCKALAKNKTEIEKGCLENLEELENKKSSLNRYAEILHSNIEKLDCTVFELFGKISAYNKYPDITFAFKNIEELGKTELTVFQNLITEYINYSHIIGYNYKNHIHYGYINTDKSFDKQKKVEALYTALIAAIDNITEILDIIEVKFHLNIKRYLVNLSMCNELFISLSKLDKVKTNWFDKKENREINEKLTELNNKIHDFQKVYEDVKTIDKELINYDIDKLYHDYKYSYSGFLRTLKKGYRKSLKFIKANTVNTNIKINYNNALELLKKIKIYKESVKYFNDNEMGFNSVIGDLYKKEKTDCKLIQFQLNNIFNIIPLINKYGDEDFVSVICRLNKKLINDLSNEYIKKYNILKILFDELKQLYDIKVFNYNIQDLQEVKNRLSQSKTYINNLVDWINFYKLYQQLENNMLADFIDEAIIKNINEADLMGTFLKKFYYLWVDEINRKEDLLQNFSREKQDELVKVFCEKDKLQFKIAQYRIREILSQNRPNTNMVSQNSEVSILLREGEKKRNLMPIRKLFMQIPNLIYKLKPCLLMSPMSVSSYISSNNTEFDTIVFDEASQIFPEDALGAIYRGRQLIIVGDREQLPPTNFFNAGIADGEFDKEEDEDNDIASFESILDVGNTFLNRIRLKWHYRSRYEDLITFSNRKIYKSELVTFPSSHKKLVDTGVEYIYVENGIYDRSTSRSNKAEAIKILKLVITHFIQYPKRSIGVVAFSEAQAEAIDNEIANYRKHDSSFDSFFKEDIREPFFVKNIESVQGDERDTIIFSIGYAKDKNGKMYMNFGPLSREGGERRLNVAITRAKINIKLVGSIQPTDIDSENANLGVRLLRSYIEFAKNGVHMLDKEKITGNNINNEHETSFEKEIYDFLINNGFKIDKQVGSSGYKIDMAVHHPEKYGQYVLGIECDGATYKECKTARDRDRLRKEVLTRLNWKMYRIWSTDWVKRRETEKRKLLEAIKKAILEIETPAEVLSEIAVTKAEEVTERKIIDNNKPFEFKKYKIKNWDDCKNSTPEDTLIEIIKTESPVCEELLLKRMCGMYGREKITSYVKEQFHLTWNKCANSEVKKIYNFYFWDKQEKIEFRIPDVNDEPRKIEQIYIDELIDGILIITKANIGITKEGLISETAKKLGYKKTSEQMSTHIENAVNEAEKRNLIVKKNEMYSVAE
jgi:superfamily I DNA and/or RNA helicase/very-short-patch-repair endonuclease